MGECRDCAYSDRPTYKWPCCSCRDTNNGRSMYCQEDGEQCLSPQKNKAARMDDCEYCHEDLDGYVKPIEKNGHAYIGADTIIISLGRRICVCQVNYCPMCGRRLKDGN